MICCDSAHLFLRSQVPAATIPATVAPLAVGAGYHPVIVESGDLAGREPQPFRQHFVGVFAQFRRQRSGLDRRPRRAGVNAHRDQRRTGNEVGADARLLNLAEQPSGRREALIVLDELGEGLVRPPADSEGIEALGDRSPRVRRRTMPAWPTRISWRPTKRSPSSEKSRPAAAAIAATASEVPVASSSADHCLGLMATT